MYDFKSNTQCKCIKFLAFYIALLLTTYIGFAEEFIIGIFLILMIIEYSKDNLRFHYSPNNLWLWFVLYYMLATLLGLIAKFLTFKSFVEFFMQFMFMPFIAWSLIPSNQHQRICSIICMKNFVLVAMIYGTIETMIRYNPLVYLVKINAAGWIVAMNGTHRAYQPSSFFLHYSYYGCVLLMGWLLLNLIPYKKNFINIIYGFILLIQLYFTQSRICWIAAIIIIFYHLAHKRIIVIGVLRKIVAFSAGAIFIALGLFIYDFKALDRIISTMYDRFNVVFIHGMAYGSLGQRIGTLLNWPKYFEKHAFWGSLGAGFRGINEAFLNRYSYFPGYSTADCQWTIFLVEVGIIGTIIVLAAVIKFIFHKNKNINYEFAKQTLILFLVLSITLDIFGTNFISIFLFWGMMLYYKGVKERSTDYVKSTYNKTKIYGINSSI